MPTTIIREQLLFKIYLEVDGTRWRLYDCRMEAGQLSKCECTPHSLATHRVFVHQNGIKKSYRFTKGESHELTESRLEEQLKRSAFVVP